MFSYIEFVFAASDVIKGMKVLGIVSFNLYIKI